jgi:hypothetical protein
MKLTNALRDQFIIAIMADVPKVDYRGLIEKTVRAEGEAKLPEAVRKAIKDPTVAPYLKHNRIYVENHGTIYGFMPESWELKASTLETIVSYQNLNRQQEKKRKEIESNLRTIASSCTTTEKLGQKLPEFVTYIPKPKPPEVKELPMVTTLISDMVKLGWPADAQLALSRAAQ